MEAADWLTDTDTRACLERVSTATVTTQLMKRGFRSRFMRGRRPLRPGTRMVGPARTLRYAPMREDLDTLESLGARTTRSASSSRTSAAGEVLVIDGLGQTGAGSLGSILALRLQVRGAAGIVTDGAFRDTPGHRRARHPRLRAPGQNANTNLTIYHPADFDCIDRLRRRDGRAGRRRGRRRRGRGRHPAPPRGRRSPRTRSSRSCASTSSTSWSATARASSTSIR
jgi:hypothetical protein